MRPSLIILGASALLVGLLAASSTTTTAQAAGPLAGHGTLAAMSMARADELERRVVKATNRVRARKGCRPLRPVRSLRRAADQHSLLMARYGRLSHRLPGERSLYARARAAGYRDARLVGENIGYGQRTANRLVRDWLGSPAHRRNLLDCRWRHIGVGVVEAYGVRWWTQDLGRR
jgi:uncharacterized protein YkwD